MLKEYRFKLKEPHAIVLLLILALAFVLRFYGLTQQSLWLDELHTVIETDPATTWRSMFDYLKCCDPHPPLYFVSERLLFMVFGHTDWVARSLSALCGVVSVWAMYLLGKELLNQRLGVIAAWLTCINYYNIYYSQEARCYIMALLFTVFSFLYFIKLIKGLKTRHAYGYAIFTLLLLYSHYYSLFIVAGQAVIAFVLMFGEKENRKQFLKAFAIAGVIVAVGYLPWVPRLIEKANMTSFWISPIQPTFAVEYFYTYFGHFDLLKPFLGLLLAYYCFQVFSETTFASLKELKQSPLQLSFFMFLICLVTTYLIPYIRSVKVLPMLYDRYTIVLVPLFLMAIAFSIVHIRNRPVQMLVLSVFVLLSLTDLLVTRKYYSEVAITKTQFREMTQFIAEEKTLYPIVEERSAWHHSYYLKKFNYNVNVFPGSKEATVDSILNQRGKYAVNGFWVVGIGGEPHLRPEVRQQLDTAFILTKEKDFFDTWTELYISKSAGVNSIMKYFPKTEPYYNAMAFPIWGGPVASQPIPVTQGKYEIRITSMGTKALDVYPHVSIYVDDRKIGDLVTTEGFTESVFSVEVPDEREIILKLDLDNDLQASDGDRNVFVKSIILAASENK